MKFAVLFAVGLVTINLATATDLALVGAITVGAAAVAGSALLLAGSVAVGASVGRSLFRAKRAVSYCLGEISKILSGLTTIIRKIENTKVL